LQGPPGQPGLYSEEISLNSLVLNINFIRHTWSNR
jgi:hypothetical protein